MNQRSENRISIIGKLDLTYDEVYRMDSDDGSLEPVHVARNANGDILVAGAWDDQEDLGSEVIFTQTRLSGGELLEPSVLRTIPSDLEPVVVDVRVSQDDNFLVYFQGPGDQDTVFVQEILPDGSTLDEAREAVAPSQTTDDTLPDGGYLDLRSGYYGPPSFATSVELSRYGPDGELLSEPIVVSSRYEFASGLAPDVFQVEDDLYLISYQRSSTVDVLAVALNEPPTGDVFIDEGPAEIGAEVRFVSETIADEDGVGEFSFQWMRDGQRIRGATEKAYVPVERDEGAQLSLRVEYTDGNGTREFVESDPTSRVRADDDTGTDGPDLMEGTAGNDVLAGRDGDDTMFGYAGEDTLDGGSGDDVMHGGAGNDTYYVDDLGDLIVERSEDGGHAVVVASVDVDIRGQAAGIKDVILVGTDGLVVQGNDLGNRIDGSAGNDEIHGRKGRDHLYGHDGDDYLHAGSGGGEWPRHEEVYGGDGNDTLVSGVGNVVLQGGEGDDTYIVNDERAWLSEAGIRSYDTVISSVDITLRHYDDEDEDYGFEKLVLVDSARVGRASIYVPRAEIIKGNALDNDLSRGETLVGGEGDDYLHDGDVLVGGRGNDRLEGDYGDDQFAFFAGADQGTDVILDWNARGERDKIALDDHFFSEFAEAGINPREVTQAQARAALDSGKVAYDQSSGEFSIGGDVIVVIEGAPEISYEDVLLF